MSGKTPSKPFQVVTMQPDGSEQLIEQGADLASLLPDYEKAVAAARRASKKDKGFRAVYIQHTLAMETMS